MKNVLGFTSALLIALAGERIAHDDLLTGGYLLIATGLLKITEKLL
jgi:hypothetical protein